LRREPCRPRPAGVGGHGCIPRERGSALVVALVALVAMLVAGFALFRSLEAAITRPDDEQFARAARLGADHVLADVQLGLFRSHPDVRLNVEDRNADQPAASYHASTLPIDRDGVPQVLAGLAPPTWSFGAPTATGWPGERIDAESRQLRRYTIERLCTAPGVATAATCRLYEVDYAQTCARVRGGGCAPASVERLPFVRVTVRIDGPRNAIAYAQFLMKAE
jgi:hypothetical protein